MRRAWHDGTRAILFEPLELIEKLAALVPKPRINLGGGADLARTSR
jgi:hypothetical protein